MKKSVFRGRIVEVNLETVCLPNGHEVELEVIHHPGGAAVLALDEHKRVGVLNQFRHAAGGYIWELPAGKIDNREAPQQTAQRELQEEVGRRAARWDSLGDYVSSPGIFTEVVHLFLARDLTLIDAQPEQHEVFEVHWRPFKQMLQMATTGEMRDGKSLVAIFRAARRFPELLL